MKSIKSKQINLIKKDTLKFFLKVKKQHFLITKVLKKYDKKILEEIIFREVKINKKYASLFKRRVYDFALINAYGEDLRIIISNSYIIYELERIADYVKNAALFLIDNFNIEEKILNILFDLWKKIISDFENIEKLLISSSLKKIKDFLHNRIKNFFSFEEMQNMIKKFSEKNNIDFLYNSQLFFQLKIISRTYDHLTNLCEWILFEKSFLKFKEYQKNN